MSTNTLTVNILGVDVHYNYCIQNDGYVKEIQTVYDPFLIQILVSRTRISEHYSFFHNMIDLVRHSLRRLISMQHFNIIKYNQYLFYNSSLGCNYPTNGKITSYDKWFHQLTKNRFFYELEYFVYGYFLWKITQLVKTINNWSYLVLSLNSFQCNPISEDTFTKLLELTKGKPEYSELLSKYHYHPRIDKIDEILKQCSVDDFSIINSLYDRIIAYSEEDIIRSVKKNTVSKREEYIIGGRALETFSKVEATGIKLKRPSYVEIICPPISQITHLGASSLNYLT